MGDRGAEIRLGENEDAEDADDEPERLHQLAHRPRRRSPREQGARPDQNRDLGELGGLHADRADEEPALRAVDRRRDDEHGNAEEEGPQKEHRRDRPQPVVVEARCECEQQKPRERVRALLDEERHRITGAERRRRRGGAEHHHEAECDEPERDEDEKALFELSGRPGLHPWSFCTSFPNSCPRTS